MIKLNLSILLTLVFTVALSSPDKSQDTLVAEKLSAKYRENQLD